VNLSTIGMSLDGRVEILPLEHPFHIGDQFGIDRGELIECAVIHNRRYIATSRLKTEGRDTAPLCNEAECASDCDKK
jgi:hypothetical protein